MSTTQFIGSLILAFVGFSVGGFYAVRRWRQSVEREVAIAVIGPEGASGYAIQCALFDAHFDPRRALPALKALERAGLLYFSDAGSRVRLTTLGERRQDLVLAQAKKRVMARLKSTDRRTT